MVVLPHSSVFQLRRRSILRAIFLALFALVSAMGFAGFPRVRSLHGSRWQAVAVLVACWALFETMRCLGRRWTLYHAGVVLLLYSELMILAMAMVLWLYL